MYADVVFFFSSRRRHTRYIGDWSSDVCSSDLCCAVRPLPRSRRLRTIRLRLTVTAPAPQVLMGGTLELTIRRVESSCAARSKERRVGKECKAGWAPLVIEEKNGVGRWSVTG